MYAIEAILGWDIFDDCDATRVGADYYVIYITSQHKYANSSRDLNSIEAEILVRDGCHRYFKNH